MTRGDLSAGWSVRRFSDIAQSVTERVDDPSGSGLDHYVGLEHLDPESVTIRRWGSPADVESTKLRFYAGDVIYARRRAYQRKLGVAEWSGICSAHALVLRAQPEVCLPEFLPYFLLSDQFHSRALDISVGSLSPTINWKTLAVQEFVVPPLDEQRRVASEMRGFDDLADELANVTARSNVLRLSIASEVFASSSAVPRVHLTDLVRRPIQYGVLKPGPEYRGGVRCIDVKDYPEGRLLVDGVRRIDPAIDAQFERSRVAAGDILISIRGTIGRVTTVPAELDGANISRDSARVSLADSVDPAYVRIVLESGAAQTEMRGRVVGLAVKGINIADLRRVTIPLPAIEEQRELAARSEAAREVGDRAVQSLTELRVLRRAFLAHALEGASLVQ